MLHMATLVIIWGFDAFGLTYRLMAGMMGCLLLKQNVLQISLQEADHH